jgi:hypothetical protein
MPAIRDEGGPPIEFLNTVPQVWTPPAQATVVPVDTTATQTLTNKTLTSAVLTTPALTGGTVLINTVASTGAGTNLATATALTVTPITFYSVTGATDTGFRLSSPVVGSMAVFRKRTTDTINLYATTGATINGGTSAVAISAVGAMLFCAVAGDWLVMNIAS